MAKAHERLGHVYDRIKSAHNTLQSIVDRAEGKDSGSGTSSIDGQIAARINHIIKLQEEAMPDGWGSFPKTVKEKRNRDGVEYTVEQYEYGTKKYPSGPVQSAVLKELNMLLGRAANLDVRKEIKAGEEEVPAFVSDHAKKLGDLIAEMDKMIESDPDHPYGQHRTRES